MSFPRYESEMMELFNSDHGLMSSPEPSSNQQSLSLLPETPAPVMAKAPVASPKLGKSTSPQNVASKANSGNPKKAAAPKPKSKPAVINGAVKTNLPCPIASSGTIRKAQRTAEPSLSTSKKSRPTNASKKKPRKANDDDDHYDDDQLPLPIEDPEVVAAAAAALKLEEEEMLNDLESAFKQIENGSKENK
jgi:hypothetical protein